MPYRENISTPIVTQLNNAWGGPAQSDALHRESCGARSLLPCGASLPVEKRLASDRPLQSSLQASPCSLAFRLTLRDLFHPSLSSCLASPRPLPDLLPLVLLQSDPVSIADESQSSVS